MIDMDIAYEIHLAVTALESIASILEGIDKRLLQIESKLEHRFTDSSFKNFDKPIV